MYKIKIKKKKEKNVRCYKINIAFKLIGIFFSSNVIAKRILLILLEPFPSMHSCYELNVIAIFVLNYFLFSLDNLIFK
jgi:hypothetical protein